MEGLVTMLIVNNRTVMGKHVNGLWLNIIGWLTTLLMFIATIALVLTLGRS